MTWMLTMGSVNCHQWTAFPLLVTCILALHLDGSKGPLLIITKGKKDRIEHVSGICILQREKAWSTQAVLKKWIDFMLPLISRGSQRGLIVGDSASLHCAKDLKNFPAEREHIKSRSLQEWLLISLLLILQEINHSRTTYAWKPMTTLKTECWEISVEILWSPD